MDNYVKPIGTGETRISEIFLVARPISCISERRRRAVMGPETHLESHGNTIFLPLYFDPVTRNGKPKQASAVTVSSSAAHCLADPSQARIVLI